MTSGTSALDMTREPVPLLVDECRTALGRSETYESWVKEQAPDKIVDVYRWALDHDPMLLREMRRRQPTRDAILLAAAEALRRPAEPPATAIDLLVLAGTSGDPPFMPFSFPTSVSKVFQPIVDKQDRAEAYAELVRQLADYFGGEANRNLRRGGWPKLLRHAGASAFTAHDPASATQLLDEAWRYVDELPSGHIKSAMEIARIVRWYVSALCHLSNSPGRDWVDAMMMAQDRIAFAREVMSAHDRSVEVAQGLAELGISEAQLWYVLRRQRAVAFHEGEQRRLAALDQAMRDLDTWLPDDAEAGADTPTHGLLPSGKPIPQQLRRLVAHLMDKIAATTAELGLSERSSEAVARAIELSETPKQLLDSLLNALRTEVNTERRIRQFESLYRHIDAGELDKLSAWQRDRLAARLAAASVDLSKVLYLTKRPTAAWFWQQQADALQNRPVTLEDRPVERGGPIAELPDAPDALEDDELALPDAALTDEATPGVDDRKANQEATSTGQDPRERLERSLSQQHAVAIVLNLMKIAKSTSPLADVIETLAAVDGWQPPARIVSEGRLSPAECTSRDQVERAALELADEFAVNYASWLRPQLLNRLARNADVVEDGAASAAAHEAFSIAMHMGRWNEAVRAQRVLLANALQNGDDAGLGAAAEATCDVVRSAIISARGAADLIDLARWMTKASTAIACWLAKREHADLAFLAAIASLGALNRIFLDTPELAEEFELAEQFRNQSPSADEQLLSLMRKRLTQPLPPAAHEPVEAAETAAAFRPSTSFVQLLGAPHEGYWALGHSVTQGGTRAWAVPLEVDAGSLDRLRRAVWFELRPARRNRRSVGALTTLHKVIVAPLLPHLGEADDLVVIPHQGFAGLPVHAARGPDSHLIERHRVSYMPSLTKPAMMPSANRKALVAGWDPEISAGLEALGVTRQLRALGFEVARPKKAARGRQELLEPESRWHIIHIAAHGDFHPWPASMGSRLRLSRSVAVTAGEWLRSGCQATFAFTNACSVGRHTPHAGDLNGFPLALRARGVVSEIAALAPVPTAGGHRFAHIFYDNWRGQDSLTAYQQACRTTIADGGRPYDWAPYLHAGVPVSLGAPEPQRRRQRGGRARFRVRQRGGKR